MALMTRISRANMGKVPRLKAIMSVARGTGFQVGHLAQVGSRRWLNSFQALQEQRQSGASAADEGPWVLASAGVGS